MSMHDLPRQKLSELLTNHGLDLCDDSKKLEGLLKDVLRNEYKRETFVLISALREGVARELHDSTSGMPLAALVAKLTRHLCDNLGLEEAVARWGVESWAFSLGVVSSHPLQPQRGDIRPLLKLLPDEPELLTEFTNSIGMKFVLIQPGEFTMGSNAENDEKPPHIVEITQPFYLGIFPVTQQEYEEVMEWNPSQYSWNKRFPVEHVNWNDTVNFCKKLSQLPAEVERRANYRLPTEAEWEYACRAGSTGKWCFGDDESLLDDYAWFRSNSELGTHVVGKKKPNIWGLYDMHGNVSEWCSDCYDAYSTGVKTDPRCQKDNIWRTVRGGGISCSAAYCRAATRSMQHALIHSWMHGFRVALSASIE